MTAPPKCSAAVCFCAVREPKLVPPERSVIHVEHEYPGSADSAGLACKVLLLKDFTLRQVFFVLFCLSVTGFLVCLIRSVTAFKTNVRILVLFLNLVLISSIPDNTIYHISTESLYCVLPVVPDIVIVYFVYIQGLGFGVYLFAS